MSLSLSLSLSLAFLVKNIEVDFINYEGSKDFQIIAKYVDKTTLIIIVNRLDTMNKNEGWDNNEKLQLFLCDSTGHTHQIEIPPSPNSSILSFSLILPQEFHPLEPSDITISEQLRKNYNPFPRHYPCHINLEAFNSNFNTDIVTLPSSMFAVGIKDGGIYQYHDSYNEYPWTYEINLTIQHIIAVALEMRPIPNFYFLICALDGYMESHYPSFRTFPHRHDNPDEYRGKFVVYTHDEHAYPLLHKNKYILAQSIHPDTSYTIAVPDRYYFCLNRYNLYHSVHRGIPFKNKISKIVYAGNIRGNKFNFTTRKDIDMNPRDYFKNVIINNDAPKEYIHAPNHIERGEMINYKYILDIDGNASTWDATAWKLNSNSVIFKSDSNWAQWFYDQYKPYVHYIPVKDDFSDIQEKFNWCEKNQDKCEEISNNAKKLFNTIYLHENVVEYTKNLIING